MARTIIIGSGVVGKLLHQRLSLSGTSVCLPARSVLTEDWHFPKAVVEPDAIVFAHGSSVNVYGFRWRSRSLLASRTEVLKRVRGQITPTRKLRAVLVSSTVAYLPPEQELARLQHEFENCFLELFSWASPQLLRVGTLLTPDSQLVRGLHALRRSVLYARLRLIGGTDIPWTEEEGLVRGIASALASADERTTCIACAAGLDYNAVMDRMVGKRPCWHLPPAAFHFAWRLLAVQPAFFTISTAMIPPSELGCRAGMSAEPSVDQVLATLG